MPEHGKGHKGRKLGRAIVKCSKYKSEHRRKKNNPMRTAREDERTPHPTRTKRDEQMYANKTGHLPGTPKRAATSPGNGLPGQKVARKSPDEMGHV